MHHADDSIEVNATPDQTWQVLSDLGLADVFIAEIGTQPDDRTKTAGKSQTPGRGGGITST